MEKKTKIVDAIAPSFRGTKYPVRFPNVGEMLDIESLKTAYSGGRYGVMVASGVRSMNLALDMIDAMAFIEVKLPQIKAAINLPKGKTLMEMGVRQANELVMWYKAEIAPWYNQIMNELYAEGVSNTEGADAAGADAQ